MDGYRADHASGKELNADQKAAIAKYDEVLQTLEFSRELSSQFKGLAAEEDKTRKKLARKEAQERSREEAKKIAGVLEVQVLFTRTYQDHSRLHFIRYRCSCRNF